jgi:hypothetical protein
MPCCVQHEIESVITMQCGSADSVVQYDSIHVRMEMIHSKHLLVGVNVKVQLCDSLQVQLDSNVALVIGIHFLNVLSHLCRQH